MRISDWSSDVCSSDLQLFPDHAAISEAAWLAAGGDPEIGDLIGMDMDVHLLKGDDVESFSKRPQARALLITALSEVHANASMFGGIESTSRSEEHTSELQSLMRISYAVFCLKKKIHHITKRANKRRKAKS